jgi:16S rRNA (cytosine1402-N4)-methyltransferase
VEASRHVPVMLEEVLRYLEPAPGKVIVDLTLGGAGHARALLEAGATVIGLDRDPQAIERARQLLSPHVDRFVPVHRDFGSLPEVLDELGIDRVDGVLMDLGLSSDQLDDPTRGFAFRLQGPLDLRFDPTRGEPAWVRIEATDAPTLARWLTEYGEVRIARRLAQAMIERARTQEMRTTEALRELVIDLAGKRERPEGELARVFQALRVLVNEELPQLERVLDCLPDRLNPGGRMVAISYHSLEDRRVKTMLHRSSGRSGGGDRHRPPLPGAETTFRELTRRVVKPTDGEIERNPRARSARLRAGVRR